MESAEDKQKKRIATYNDTENMREYSVIEALPELEAVAKAYSLKLNRLSDFRIARAIWANALRSSIYM